MIWHMKRCTGPDAPLDEAYFDTLEEALAHRYPDGLPGEKVFSIKRDDYVQYGTNYGWTTFERTL